MNIRVVATMLGLILGIGCELARAHDLKGLTNDKGGFSSQIQAALAEVNVADEQTRSVLSNLRLWPVPRKLTICFVSGSTELRKRVTQSMMRVWPIQEITEHRLEYDNDSFSQAKDCSSRPTEDIRVDFKAKEGYWSYIGLESRRQFPSMNLEFTESSPANAEFDRLVGHEMGHALGLEHEHQSPAGPDCGWDFKYIYSHYAWKDEADMHNNFDKLKDYIYKGHHAYSYTIPDRTSLMEYDFEPEAFEKGKASPCYIRRNYIPSNQDRLAIQTAYGPGTTVEITRGIATNLKGALSEKAYSGISELVQARLDLLAH